MTPKSSVLQSSEIQSSSRCDDDDAFSALFEELKSNGKPNLTRELFAWALQTIRSRAKRPPGGAKFFRAAFRTFDWEAERLAAQREGQQRTDAAVGGDHGPSEIQRVEGRAEIRRTAFLAEMTAAGAVDGVAELRDLLRVAQQNVNMHSFETWWTPVRAVGLREAALNLEVPSKMFVRRLSETYRTLFLSWLDSHREITRVVLLSFADGGEASVEAAAAPSALARAP